METCENTSFSLDSAENKPFLAIDRLQGYRENEDRNRRELFQAQAIEL